MTVSKTTKAALLLDVQPMHNLAGRLTSLLLLQNLVEAASIEYLPEVPTK